MSLTWDELAGRSLARQFPAAAPDSVVEMVSSIGAMQTQTARSAFIGLAARFPGVTHEAITASYETAQLVRGSTIRGTVHTATPAQHAALDVTTRLGQRSLWTRLLKPTTFTLEELWADTETFAHPEWRSAEQLGEHLDEFLRSHDAAGTADRLASQQGGRYLAFGHGGLVRRPAVGDWSGQGRPVYRAAAAVVDRPQATVDDAVALHVRCHGPVSRHDIAWWSGLGLRAVDEALDRLGLVGVAGPDARTYVDVPEAPAARDLPGVRLLPEFDALLCGYDSKARDRFVDPAHHALLWTGANGLMLSPLLVDGRLTGFWRAGGSARRRPLDVRWFPGTRRVRRAELEEPVAAIEAGLGITISEVSLGRA